MTQTSTPQTTPPAGEPPVPQLCGTCAAPLAEDQRYCLSCGTRRGQSRVEYATLLRPSDPGSPANPPDVAPTPSPQTDAPRTVSPLGAAAGLGLLLLAILVGAVIGGGRETPAPAPPIVLPAATTPPPADVPATTPDDTAADDGDAKKSSSKASDAAADKALSELENASPDEYVEKSKKLPDEVGTGGTAPPVDNKAPGGGSDDELIIE